MTGEVKRAFLKHQVYGTVFCVEIDETGQVLAAKAISEATACRHQKDVIELGLDEAAEINKHLRDYEDCDPGCTDSTHLLSEIGEAEKACQVAEGEWGAAAKHAKSLKEIFEMKQDRVRSLVREATDPKPLPLFDKSAA